MASMVLRYWQKMRGGGSAVFTPPAPDPEPEVPSNAISLIGGGYLATLDGDYITTI